MTAHPLFPRPRRPSCESGPTGHGLPPAFCCSQQRCPTALAAARIPIASSVWLIPAARGSAAVAEHPTQVTYGSVTTSAHFAVSVAGHVPYYDDGCCRKSPTGSLRATHNLKRPSDTDQVSDDDAPMRVCFHSHFSIDTSRSPSLTLDEIYHPLTRAPRCPAHERFGRMQRPLWRKRPATLLGCGVPSTRGGLNRRAEHKTRKAAPHRFGRRAFEK